MNEHTFKFRVIVEPPNTAGTPTIPTIEPTAAVMSIFQNMKSLRDAPPYAVAMIKKELKKFSIKSMKWEDQQ